jgi:hypothetical protein
VLACQDIPKQCRRAVATSGRASDQAGVKGAASPLAEREVPSPFSPPPQAAKKAFATALSNAIALECFQESLTEKVILPYTNFS